MLTPKEQRLKEPQVSKIMDYTKLDSEIIDCINSSRIYSDNDIFNYRLFSSWNIKYDMLKQATKLVGQDILIDMASGRGNDINRWNSLGIKRVIGIEYDKSQYEEAIRRYKKIRNIKTKVSYINMSVTEKNLYDILCDNIKKRGELTNLITCNFALNYFIDSHNFFRTISHSLKTGGLFIGTAADGDIIKYLFNNFGNEINTKLYYIKQIDSKKYNFKLNTPYFQDINKNNTNTNNKDNDEEFNVITESFLYKQKLITMAKKYGLVPYSIKEGVPALYNFSNYPLLYNEKNSKPYERHIDIATLFFGFSFIKASKDLLNKINNPRCLVLHIDENGSLLKDGSIYEGLKGPEGHDSSYNYVIIKRTNMNLPEHYYHTYPVNTMLFFKENNDYFSSERYIRNPKEWEIILISVDAFYKGPLGHMNMESIYNPKDYVYYYV